MTGYGENSSPLQFLWIIDSEAGSGSSQGRLATVWALKPARGNRDYKKVVKTLGMEVGAACVHTEESLKRREHLLTSSSFQQQSKTFWSRHQCDEWTRVLQTASQTWRAGIYSVFASATIIGIDKVREGMATMRSIVSQRINGNYAPGSVLHMKALYVFYDLNLKIHKKKGRW